MKIGLLSAPSNLGLRPPAPTSVKLPVFFPSFFLVSRIQRR
jgi:hypothetical protein